MANSQFGYDVTAPTTGTTPYGCSVDFVVSTGVDTIASKTGAGGWCTAGNLLAFSNTGQSGNYLECSITYAYNISGLSRGWYFWYGYNGSGFYLSLGTNPVGDSVTIDIQWNGSQFQATLTDHTHSGNNKVAGFGSGTPAQFAIKSANVWFENGGDTTCADYNSFGGVDFKNMTYYDSSSNTISYTPTHTAHTNPNNPNGCTPSVSWG